MQQSVNASDDVHHTNLQGAAYIAPYATDNLSTTPHVSDPNEAIPSLSHLFMLDEATPSPPHFIMSAEVIPHLSIL